MCRHRSDRRLNRFSTQTSGTATAQTSVLQLTITSLDHNAGFGVSGNHVHVIHLMHMWTEMRVCLVVTEQELVLNGSVATVPTHGRCDGCRQNGKQYDEGCRCAHHCVVQYKQILWI